MKNKHAYTSFFCTLFCLSLVTITYAATIIDLVRNGQERAVALALYNNKNAIDTVDIDGKTPLMWAIITKRPDIVQDLLDANPNLNIKDKFGKTALAYSVETEQPAIGKLILEKAKLL